MNCRGITTSIRAVLCALVLVACDSPPPNCVEVPGIAYVHTRRRSEDDVARASELFSAKENHGQDIVFRTVENVRAGYYFYMKLDIDPPPDGRLVLEIVRTEESAPERYDFSLKLLPKFPFGELVIGLTGKDAGLGRWTPIAWRLSVLDGQGKLLASEHSFLWGTRVDLQSK